MKNPSIRQLSILDRLNCVFKSSSVDLNSIPYFTQNHPPLQSSEQWIENSLGYYSLPIGVVDHFVADQVKRYIPLATEETSIIAALSSCLKWIQNHGTLTTGITGTESIGQIHFPYVENIALAKEIIFRESETILKTANECVPGLVSRGGGFKRLDVRTFQSMLIIHLYCDCKNAMGANLINQACEKTSIIVEKLIESRAGLRILSNLVDDRMAWAKIELKNLPEDLVQRIEEASLFAEADPYRAATHNKGIMNGIDGVLIATGNDWRAVEAGAHAYAARSGSYQPLSRWRKKDKNNLEGFLEMPLAVGTVGGMTQTHPQAAASLKLMNIENATDLSRICVAVGLAQNCAALKALVSDGIVMGHMKLHLKNLIMCTDATNEEKDELLEAALNRFKKQKIIPSEEIKNLLKEMRLKSN